MILFDIWKHFGFRENPFSQETLEADSTGDRLLVGRDKLVDTIQRRIGSAGTHLSVEGPVGVGKSSLLKVAAYRMKRECIGAPGGVLFLPTVDFLEARQDTEEFEDNVYRNIAQTLIQDRDAFKRAGLYEPNTDDLDGWLNAAQYNQRTVGGSFAGMGGQLGRGASPNTSRGFTLTGFRDHVRTELRRCFPPGTGGIICVLDNLELLETTGEARATLDALRDRLFDIPQLRWVLCGSRGIVSRARSERLSGIFQAPVQVGPLSEDWAVEAVARRLQHFGMESAQPPVSPQGFEFLYRALNLNLRDALSTAQEYAQWLYEEYIAEGAPLPDAKARDQLLESWLAERAQLAYHDAGNVQARNWQFFVDLANDGGRVGSAEHLRFGFRNQQQLGHAVTQLSDANLVVRETDPEHGSKTVNAVTALGWLVYFHRNNYRMPPPRHGTTMES